MSSNSSFAHHHQRLLHLLRELAYARREVILSSGRKSNFYIDCRQVVLRAEGHFLVGWLLNHQIRHLSPDAVAVGGLSMGADPLASAASLMSHLGPHPLDAFYIRKEPKKHGTEKYIEGADHLPKDAKVAIVEDVVTTGSSTLKAIERALQLGLCPVRVFALVDREEGGRENIEKVLPLTALFKRSDFPQ